MLDNLADAAVDLPNGAPPAPFLRRTPWEPDGARHKSIIILGSHPVTVLQAPFADQAAYIYACSPHNVEKRVLPRVDCFCELHAPIEDPTRAFPYLKAVSEMPVVLMRDKRALASGVFKGAHPYPEKEIKGTFEIQTVKVPTGTYRHVPGPDGKPRLVEIMEKRQVEVPNMDGMFNPYMFTSSIAYMLAKAIADCEREGIKQISVYGVMQASENEYVYQRPGIQYFLHEAMKRGIKVICNREACLFDMPQWKW
jgi:hypothetical protein